MRLVCDDLIAALSRLDGPASFADLPAVRRGAVADLAASERLLPTLGYALVRAGVTPAVPASLAGFVRAKGRTVESEVVAAALAYELNRARMADLLEQATTIGAALDAAGISWVPLKGAALLLDDVWPDAAAREMTDLDILIPDELQLDAAKDVLTELGYAPVSHEVLPTHPVLEDNHQLRAMRAEGRAGSVELHRSLVPDEHADHFGTVAVIGRISRTPRGLRLAPADMIRHVAVHARLSDWTLRTSEPRLRSVLDVVYLLRGGTVPAGHLFRDDDTRAVTRALRAHLAAVEDVGRLGLRVSLQGRLWWAWTRFVASSPRRAWAWKHLTMLPLFLRRDRMEARTGRTLRGRERIAVSLRLAAERARRAVRSKG